MQGHPGHRRPRTDASPPPCAPNPGKTTMTPNHRPIACSSPIALTRLPRRQFGLLLPLGGMALLAACSKEPTPTAAEPTQHLQPHRQPQLHLHPPPRPLPRPPPPRPPLHLLQAVRPCRWWTRPTRRWRPWPTTLTAAKWRPPAIPSTSQAKPAAIARFMAANQVMRPGPARCLPVGRSAPRAGATLTPRRPPDQAAGVASGRPPDPPCAGRPTPCFPPHHGRTAVHRLQPRRR